MAKNHNNKARSVKNNDTLTGPMKFFLAGCVAELYLLIVRRYYVYGKATQMIAWYDYLKYLAIIGLVVAAAGAVMTGMWRTDKKKRIIGLSVLGVGAFLGIASALIRMNPSFLTLLTIVVPVFFILVLLWSLYDRECGLSLIALSVALVLVWLTRRVGSNAHYAMATKAVDVIYVVLAAGLAWLLKSGKQIKNLLPAKMDKLPVYVACGLGAAAVILAMFSSVVAYYVMWLLAAVVFALAVYYTVKQL